MQYYGFLLLSSNRTMTEPFLALLYHQRRVGLVLWHPSAESILLTAGKPRYVNILALLEQTIIIFHQQVPIIW